MNDKDKALIEKGLTKLRLAFPTEHPTQQTWKERGEAMTRWEWGIRKLHRIPRTTRK